MLHIHVLGVPYLSWNNTSLTIARRIPRAILYYLAVGGKPVSRSSLQTLFWPEESEEVARARLRDNLTKLRAALPDPDLVQTFDETLLLAPEKVWVDLLEFNDLLAQVGQLPWQLLPTEPLPATVYQTLEKAAKLWHGPSFLAGSTWPENSSLDEWQRARGHEIYHTLQRVLTRLIDHETATGNLERVLDWALMAIQLDDLDQDLHYLLLKTYLDLNRRSEARKHYQEVEALFENELGSGLPENILSLKGQIFDTSPPTQPVPPLEWSTYASIHTPFVGRSEVIEQLDRICSTNSGAIIFGEAGIGKTRLVQECYQRRETKPRLLLATGHSTESNLPYHIWINLMRRSIGPDEWQLLSPTWAAPLTSILPELKEIHHDLQPQDLSSLNHPRTVLLEAIHQLLRMLAESSPLLVFIDDVHWADESSLAILSYLLHHSFFDNGRNFLIMAARTEEKNPWLDKLLLSISSKKIRQIEVRSLETKEVAHLVQYVLGQLPPQGFVERLVLDTGGNPLYVLETLQFMLQAGRDQGMEEIMDIPLAPSIHKSIQARMQLLSDLALDILSVGALLGVEFDLSLIQQMTKADTVNVLDALVELEVARFIRSRQQEGQPRYSFVHEITRESVLIELSPARRRLLHAKIAVALEQYFGGRALSSAAWIAYHYQESGNLLKAFDYCIQAARYASGLFSYQEATAAFSNAERIILREPRLSEEQIYRLYSSWTDMAFENDDSGTLFRINETLLSFGLERNSDLLIGVAYDGLSDACFAANQFERGYRFVLEATPYLQRAGNLFVALDSQMHYGTFLYMLGKFSEAHKVLYDVLEELPNETEANFERLNIDLHYQIGMLEVLMGYPVKGLGFFKSALENRQIVHSPAAVLAIYTGMGLGYFLKGDFESGQAMSLKAIDMGKQIQNQRMLGYAYAFSALNGHYLGLLDQAWEHANLAVSVGQSYGHHEISALGYHTLGNIHLRLEDYQSAIDYFERGFQVAGEHFVALELLALNGYALASAGQIEAGLEHLRRAYQVSSALDLGSISIFARSLLLLVQNWQGNNGGSINEEIEIVLDDAKKRSIHRVIALLEMPVEGVDQRADDFIKKMEENLQDVSLTTDPFFEMRMLYKLIVSKKRRGLSWQSEMDRMNAILEELAPRTVDMPYESAWQRYFNSVKTIENE